MTRMIDENNQCGFLPGPQNPLKTQKSLRMHQDSTQVQDLIFNPVRGIRDKVIRQGKKPVDHAKANRKAVSNQSKLNAQARANGDAVPKRSLKYKQTSLSSTAHSKSSSGRDFVQENIMDAGTRKGHNNEASVGESSSFLQKRDYGRVPTYLHARKMELAASYARRQAEKEAALIPPGMRFMPDEERNETLTVLEKNKADIEAALTKLPFVVKTPSQVRLKNDLERRLQEIDEAKRIFSRPKVLVKA